MHRQKPVGTKNRALGHPGAQLIRNNVAARFRVVLECAGSACASFGYAQDEAKAKLVDSKTISLTIRNMDEGFPST
jgi:hypothetical protein